MCNESPPPSQSGVELYCRIMVTKREPAPKPGVRRKSQEKKEPLSLWERLAAIGQRIPDDVIEKLPKDLARNFDHYAHGSPKQD